MLGQLLGEVFGTFTWILSGDGVVANVVWHPVWQSNAYNWEHDHLRMGVRGDRLAVYVSAGVSGAHLIPAVTLPWPSKRLPLGKSRPATCLPRSSAPFWRCRRIPGLQGRPGGCGVTGGIPNVWCTGPGSAFTAAFWVGVGSGTAGTVSVSYSYLNCFIAEVIGTAVLLWGVLASGDFKNTGRCTIWVHSWSAVLCWRSV